MRHNSGGDYYKIAGCFVTSPKNLIYIGNEGDTLKETIKPNIPFIYTKPIVILINGCSVSGGEHIAAELQPLKNVTLVGDTTAGLGGSTDDIILSSGKWLATTRFYSRYYGKLIQWNGVPPDILIQNTEDEIRQNIDNQLEFALDYLSNR